MQYVYIIVVTLLALHSDCPAKVLKHVYYIILVYDPVSIRVLVRACIRESIQRGEKFECIQLS